MALYFQLAFAQDYERLRARYEKLKIECHELEKKNLDARLEIMQKWTNILGWCTAFIVAIALVATIAVDVSPCINSGG
jgi:hypothetical protein